MNRQQRREYRATAEQWYRDGGDSRYRFDYPLGPDSVVLDVGGYEGQWASDLYARYRCKIHVFEPIAEHAAGMRARFANNPDIAVHQIALAPDSYVGKIGSNGPSSSAYRDSGSSETVVFADVATWVRAYVTGRIALLKLNIEGGEYALLERLIEQELLHKVDSLQVQYHAMAMGMCAPTRERHIRHELLAQGYRCDYRYPYVWESWSKNPV